MLVGVRIVTQRPAQCSLANDTRTFTLLIFSFFLALGIDNWEFTIVARNNKKTILFLHSKISDSSFFLYCDVLKGFHAKHLSQDTFNLHLVSTWITCPLEQFIFLSTVKLSIPIATTVNTTNANQRFVSFLQGQTKDTCLPDSFYIFLLFRSSCRHVSHLAWFISRYPVLTYTKD